MPTTPAPKTEAPVVAPEPTPVPDPVFAREPDLTIAELREKLEDLVLLSIGTQNPGINIEEVKAGRAEQGLSWVALA